MKSFKETYKSIITKPKTIISSDNFTCLLAEQSNKIKELLVDVEHAEITLKRLLDRHNKKPDDEYLNQMIIDTKYMIEMFKHNIEVLKNKNISENESDIIKNKISIEDDFIDDGILALYKIGANKYRLEFEIVNKNMTEATLFGTNKDLIGFLLNVLDMTYSAIKEDYPKLDFNEYEKETRE